MILAIETSGTICGVALQDGASLVAELEDDRPRIHDAALVRQVRDVMSDAGCEWRDLDAVACSCGPGSFTGIRIGMSMAKGLCFTLGIPLVAVPTLDALAAAAVDTARRGGAQRIMAALAAEGDKCYLGEFDAMGERIADYRLVRRGAMPALEPGTLVIGSAGLYFTELGSAYEHGITLPRARYIAALGVALYAGGQRNDPEVTEPIYVADIVHTAS